MQGLRLRRTRDSLSAQELSWLDHEDELQSALRQNIEEERKESENKRAEVQRKKDQVKAEKQQRRHEQQLLKDEQKREQEQKIKQRKFNQMQKNMGKQKLQLLQKTNPAGMSGSSGMATASQKRPQHDVDVIDSFVIESFVQKPCSLQARCDTKLAELREETGQELEGWEVTCSQRSSSGGVCGRRIDFYFHAPGRQGPFRSKRKAMTYLQRIVTASARTDVDIATGKVNAAGCMVCGRENDPQLVLLCDGCPNEAHLACVGLTSVPCGEWFCASCKSSRTADKCSRPQPPRVPSSKKRRSTEQTQQRSGTGRKQSSRGSKRGGRSLPDTSGSLAAETALPPFRHQLLFSGSQGESIPEFFGAPFESFQSAQPIQRFLMAARRPSKPGKARG